MHVHLAYLAVSIFVSTSSTLNTFPFNLTAGRCIYRIPLHGRHRPNWLRRKLLKMQLCHQDRTAINERQRLNTMSCPDISSPRDPHNRGLQQEASHLDHPASTVDSMNCRGRGLHFLVGDNGSTNINRVEIRYHLR